MMTLLPLAKIGKVLNRPACVEEAKKQFLLHLQYLFDTSTGLFFMAGNLTAVPRVALVIISPERDGQEGIVG